MCPSPGESLKDWPWFGGSFRNCFMEIPIMLAGLNRLATRFDKESLIP